MSSIHKFAVKSLAVAGVSAAAMLAATLPSQAETIRFMGWVGLFEFQKPGWDKIVEAFEAQNPGVKIEYVGTPFEDTLNQATIAVLGNNAPDIIQVTSGWVPQLAGIGALAPINELLPAETMAQFPKGAVDAVTFESGVLALPWLPGPIMLGYNRDLLAKAGLNPDSPPKTWAEFTAAVDAVCEMGKKDGSGVFGVSLRTTRDPNSAHWSLPIIWANGGSITDADGNVSFNNDGVKAAYAWYHDVISRGCSPDGFGIQESRNVFGTGRAAFIFEGPWLKGLVENLSSGELTMAADGNVWVAPMPTAEDGVIRQIENANMVVVTNQSKNKELAAKFVDFMLGNQETVDFFFETSKQPTTGRMDILRAGAMGEDAYTQAFVETLPYSNAVPIKSPKWTAMLDAVSPALQSIIKGGDASSELANADKAIQQILEDE